MMSLINVSTSLLFLVALLLNAFVNVSAFTNYQRQGSTAVRDGIIGSRAKNFGVLYASAKNIIHLDDSNYRKILNGDKPVLVDAYTQWCGPCKLIEPVLNRFAEKYDDTVIVAKYDVEAKNPNLKLELLLEYGVRPTSLPSLFLIHNKEAVAKHEGLIMDDELDKIIKSKIREESANNKSSEDENGYGRKAGFVNLGQQVDDYMLTDV